MRPTNAQCEALAAKHGIHATPAVIAIIKEAYRLGANADVMQIAYKKKKEEKSK